MCSSDLLLLACTGDPKPQRDDTSGPADDTAVNHDSPGDSPGDSTIDSDTTDTHDTREEPLATTQVLVVGAGASGLAAAMGAVEAGVEVMVLERATSPGGAGIYAGSYWAAGSRWQEEGGVKDSAALALSEWPDFSIDGDPTAELVERLVEDSGDTLEWLESYGASFELQERTSVDEGSVPRIHTSTGVASPMDYLAAPLTDKIRTSTTVTGLVEEDGRIIGVEVGPGEDGTGDTGWIAADAVIIATGGFARNDALVISELPELKPSGNWVEAHPGMDGNGLEMISAVGGALQNLDHLALYSHAVADPNFGSPEVFIVYSLSDGIIVGTDGRRAGDESLFQSVEWGIEGMTSGPFVLILDQPKFEALRMGGRGFNYHDQPEFTSMSGPDYSALAPIPSGDTVADLATELGLDPDTLESEVARYNTMFDAGVDTDFGKGLQDFSRLETGPYYGVTLLIARAKSFGGAALSPNFEVIDTDGKIGRAHV